MTKKTIRKVRDALREGGEILPFFFAGGRGRKTGVQVVLSGVGELSKVRENLEHLDAETVNGVLSVRDLRREAAIARANKRDEKAKDLACPDRIKVYECDFHRLWIEAGTVDIIWTDMPWPRPYRQLFAALAERAKVWLKPGGLLCLYPGQDNEDYANDLLRRHFPKATNNLCVYYRNGFGAKGRTIHRHASILVFSNGPLTDREWKDRHPWGLYDAIDAPSEYKDRHQWQRTLHETMFFFRFLTKPDYLVCDPFAGGFTTAEAALRLGCRFIGCDNDAQPSYSGLPNAEVGRRRVIAAWEGMKNAGTNGPKPEPAVGERLEDLAAPTAEGISVGAPE